MVLQITGNTVPLLQELITILDRIDLEKAPTFVVEVDSLLKRLADSSKYIKIVWCTERTSQM